LKLKFFFFATLIILIIKLSGCSPPSRAVKKAPPYRVGEKIYFPLEEVKDYVERGIASWYGEEFHGKRTSSGEIYNMYSKTAAHRILPFGTYVQVTNLINGKKTMVRINDRGPFIKDRIIDLSYAGAQEIGLIGPGTAPVEIKVVGTSNSSKPIVWTGNFTVQIGAFEDLKNATRLKEKLSYHYKHVYITTFDVKDKTLYRVRVGNYRTLQETIQVQRELESKGYRDAFVVAE